MAVPVADRGAPPASASPGAPPRRRILLLTAVVLVVLLVAGALMVGYLRWRRSTPAASAASRPNPVTVPLPPPKVEAVAGRPLGPGGTDLTPAPGQVVEEVFITGGARTFLPSGWWTQDGRWRVRPSAETALYATRLLIVRPIDDASFNGTVVLAWLGTDRDPAARAAAVERRRALVSEGFAWIGVSAEPEDVARLKEADPSRYDALGHAGRSYAYDIYSQAAKAVRESETVQPLGDLRIERLIGESDGESSPRLVTYVNAVQQHARLFDGFLLAKRPDVAAPLSESPQKLVATPAPSPLRRMYGAPLHVCLGGGEVEAEPERIEPPLLDPMTPAEIDEARSVMRTMGCPPAPPGDVG